MRQPRRLPLKQKRPRSSHRRAGTGAAGTGALTGPARYDHWRQQRYPYEFGAFDLPCALCRSWHVAYGEVSADIAARRLTHEPEVVAELQTHKVTRSGKESPLTLEDILIVAPYNLQVNLLKQLLPEGAKGRHGR
jgi:hypothetical protein